MKADIEKLNAMAAERSENAIEQAVNRKNNREYLRMSQRIALNIHYYLRENNISQKELAERMGVSAAYIGKIMKGNENLTLESICKLQEALGKTLIQISEPYVCKSTWQQASRCNKRQQGLLSSSKTYVKKRYSNNTYISSIGDIA